MDTQFFDTMPLQNLVKSIRTGKTQLLTTVEVENARRPVEIDETMPLDKQKQVSLVIQGVPIRLLLVQNTAITLGRTDTRANVYPDIDLTPYGGSETGVSRSHASLQYKNRTLFITDLGSSNGTYINGQRLHPNKPEPVTIGDMIVLGRLTMQIESSKLR